MRHLMARMMKRTNSSEGILRYLSKQGFDTERPIDYEDGPNKQLMYAVQGPKKSLIKKLKKGMYSPS